MLTVAQKTLQPKHNPGISAHTNTLIINMHTNTHAHKHDNSLTFINRINKEENIDFLLLGHF